MIDRELKRFGFSLGLGLIAMGLVLKLKTRAYFYWPLFFALPIIFLALIKPQFLKIIKVFLEKTGRIIITLLTGILLFLTFYLIVTSVGLIAKLCGKRFLKSGFEDIPSYFEKRAKRETDRESLERQF